MGYEYKSMCISCIRIRPNQQADQAICCRYPTTPILSTLSFTSTAATGVGSAVGVCAEDGWNFFTGISDVCATSLVTGVCLRSIQFDLADFICGAIGGRLCSADELQRNVLGKRVSELHSKTLPCRKKMGQSRCVAEVQMNLED